MKTETIEAKLMERLMRLNPEKAKQLTETKTKVENRNGNIQGISETEIQDFRAAQGVLYFLQAPELFQAKVCKHCGAHFLVSRLYVAFCSYTCISKSLEEQGFQWRKGKDIESLATDKEVYDGNEPIWVRNLPTLVRALELLTSQNSASPSSLMTASLEVRHSSTTAAQGTLKRL